ncbi:PREDICTED: long-chain-alcohol oxidase FAO1-like [Camelina sativa]|uniref:Long-chain-alcohol oxidase n=1 Tax=Camelina sativa TaxID=90675 RepID=A0ABM0WR96_CAMSA|nr:PREDICTED: long-chain-alcohol oxidase FAO1-like [Camelina sativa]
MVGRRGSPLLRWNTKHENVSHGFSASDLQALSAICEAILPPVPLQSLDLEMKLKVLRNDALLSFFKSSPGPHVRPDEVAEVLATKAIPVTVIVVRIVLRILTFRLGTLLLCGLVNLDKASWPFLLKFSEISLEKREKVLQRWNTQWYNPLARIGFMMIKAIFLFYYFTWTDENTENPAWDAIGYSVGIDENEGMEHKERPLEKGIIETDKVNEMTIKQRMINKGLKVTEDRESDTYKIECDAVVVGSGCGGGVAAANLAKSGLRVVVLEKGNYFVSRDYSALEGPSTFELFESNSLLMTHDGRFRFMAGSTVGGGSVVNWAASLKTPDAIIEEWSVQRGISIFSSEKYKAAMDRVCKRIGVTERVIREGFQNQILRKGCEKLGLDVTTVPRNSTDGHYCGSCSFGCPTGEKRGTDLTWLVDAVNNNAVILTQCKAEKVILAENDAHKRKESGRKKRCLGVAASLSNRTRKKLQINAKVTIVACGSLKTPELLASSGLKNPNIGRGLHIHPILMTWGYFPEKKSDFKGAAHEGEILTTLHYVHPMDSTTANITLETPAIGPGTFAALVPWVSGSDIKERLAKYSRTSHIFVTVRDEGVGEVKGGIVKYRLTKADEENLTIGLKQALQILVAAGAAEVGTYRSDGQRIKCDGIKHKDLEAFLETVDAPAGVVSMSKHWTHSITAHQMGCCRMGATEKEGAIDGKGESWEAEDLYVCDASVLPTALGVNPMITIQSTAYCISNRIAELMKKKKKD